MKHALWIASGLLALLFVGTGTMKLLTPYEDLTAQMAWAAHAPTWLPKFIGLAEIAGGLGLVLPTLTGIKPQLTPLAALGLMVVMLLAAGTHLVLGELGGVAFTATIFALCAFVWWGRSPRRHD